MLAIATAEKASLISNFATWSIEMPAFSKANGIALAGAMGKSTGAHAASAKATFETGHFGQRVGRFEQQGRKQVLTDDPSHRSQSELVDLLLRCENQSTGAVVQRAGTERETESSQRVISPSAINAV